MDEQAPWLAPEKAVDLTNAEAIALLPARWAVATLCDQTGAPVQLVSWKNLRRTMRGRTDEMPPHVRWRTVDSDFESDWLYLQTARALWPQTWRALVPWLQTWFVHIDPADPFPRFVKTNQLPATGEIFGPFPDKHAAARLIELVEDAFDLCRYHHILTQSPNGKACPYKEMGKCPAPCDGSISMPQYHRLIDISLTRLRDPNALISEHTARMESAAADLNFEAASRIKTYIAQLNEFNKKAFRYARPMSEFSFLTIQPGPRPGQVKLFLLSPARITPLLCLLDDQFDALDVPPPQTETPDRDVIGLIARHLFAPKATGGEFIPLSELSTNTLRTAYRRVSRKTPPPADTTGDGDTGD